MGLRSITEKIWTVDFENRIGPGFHMPARTLLYRDAADQVMMISPGPFTKGQLKAIRDLGTLKAIVAPNLFHHKSISPALHAFPEATFYRPHELLIKRPDLDGKGHLTADLKKSGIQGLELLLVRGAPSMQETLFYFPSEKLLFATDLVFHILKPRGIATKMILTVAGTRGRFAASRFLRTLTRDKEAFRQDLKKALEWDIDKLVMAHGEPLLAGAHARLSEAWKRI